MKNFIKSYRLMAALLVISMVICVACENAPKSAVIDEASTTNDNDMSIAMKAGKYQAVAHGHHSDVKVEVEVSETSINAVKVIEEGETFNLADAAINTIPALIIENQSTKVDVVSGATMTSRAILTAVDDCLNQAGGKEAVEAFNKEVKKPESTKTEQTETYDVVVVGSGATGMAAALSAQEAGAKVALLEKLDFYGGISQTIFGGMIVPLEDENETREFYNYIMEKSCGIMQEPEYLYNGIYPDESIIQKYIDNSSEMVEWLKKLGVPLFEGTRVLDNKYTLGSVLVTYDNPPDNVGHMIVDMVKHFEDNGGKTYLGTRADELIVEDGKVVGVKASSKNVNYTLNAKSVILATGGYGGNQEMVKKYMPSYAGDINFTLGTNTGDGIEMALNVGAVMYDDQTVMSGSGHLDLTDADMVNPYMDTLASKASLYVSPGGLRLNSEDPFPYTLAPTFLNPNGQDYYWIINNEAVAKEAGYLDLLETRLNENNDRFYKADTIPELANKIGITPNILRYTLNRYNLLCEAGEDKDMHKPAEYMVAMKEGPWYAVKAIITNFGTVGGIVTNAEAEVVDKDGNSIPGLYAAGEISNHGLNNLCYSQNQFGACLIFGRIAGKNAVK